MINTTMEYAVQDEHGNAKVVSREQIQAIKNLLDDTAGITSVALASIAWNTGGNIDFAQLRDEVTQFLTQYYMLKKKLKEVFG